MSSWIDSPLLAWDTETDSPIPTEARLITSTTVRIHGASTSARTWLLNPGVPISPESTEIHGITDERAQAEGMDATQGLREIALAVAGAIREGTPVVGHNIVYDLTVLDCDMRRHGLGSLPEFVGCPLRPIIDTLCVDRGVDRYRRGKRTLVAACEQYKVPLNGAHDATEDALASARVAWRIARKHPRVAAMTLDELHDAQVGWHHEWATHLSEYFASQGKPEDVSTEWPLRQPASVDA